MRGEAPGSLPGLLWALTSTPSDRRSGDAEGHWVTYQQRQSRA